MIRILALLMALASGAPVGDASIGDASIGDASSAEPPDFARVIRPLLAARCLKCHGPDAAARKAKLGLHERALALSVLVPGDAQASELLRRVLSKDPDDRMPPPNAGPPLSPQDILHLRRWIDAGAPYPTHWAFEKPSAPNERSVDAPIAAGLAAVGLEFNPEAERATLLRRLSLDLTGLPPTDEELASFLDDAGPEAYERRVDALLRSPSYGERWAVLWLDLARYADTKGYEKDARRTLWPYRDWVIRAFNRDLPFDRFTIQQLAGDLLPEPDRDMRLATGFHRNTMTNDEGGTDDEEFRVAAVIDRVDTTMQVWMGLTAGCAACHDHKFDPLSQKEYYSIFDVFNQTADSDRVDDAPLLEVPDDDTRRKIEELDRSVLALEPRVAALAQAQLVRFGLWQDQWTSQPASPTPRTPVLHAPLDGPSTSGVIDDPTFEPGIIGQAVRIDAEHVVDFGTAGDFERDQAFSFAFWQRLDGDRVQVPIARMDAGADFRGWDVFVHHRRAYVHLIHRWPDDCITVMARKPLPQGEWHHLAVTYDGSSKASGVKVYVNGQSMNLAIDHYQVKGSIRTERPLYLGRRHGERDYHGVIDELRIYDRELSANEAASLVEAGVSAAIENQRGRAFLQHYHDLKSPDPQLVQTRTAIAGYREQRQQLDESIPRVPTLQQLAAEKQRSSHVLAGGNFLSPGDPVQAAVPAAFHPWPEGTARDRLGFARWIVHPDNPLTARVFANRIWAELFGIGIVETLEDFGTQGSLPSHPALLDHLALYTVEHGWSLKSLLRHIVLSRTYRQSSRATPEKLRVDPRNRWLSRGARYRLGAETVRDQALAVAGLLSDKRFGPPVYPPQPDGVWQIVYSGDRWTVSEGEDRYRRSLYTFWRRTSPYPGFVTFDAPSREICTPRRIRTATPLQALVTLNDPTYHEAAQALAHRVLRSSADDSARIDIAFQRVLCRRPLPSEQRTVTRLLRTEMAQFAAQPRKTEALLTLPVGDANPVEVAAWTIVAGVLLNLDEFLTRN